jgi:hypothetical protein
MYSRVRLNGVQGLAEKIASDSTSVADRKQASYLNQFFRSKTIFMV